jgi:hypothetical protein
LQTSDFSQITILGSLEYSPSQVPDYSIAVSPIDVIPIGSSLGYAYIPYGLHLTFPKEFGSLFLKFKRLTNLTSAAFQLGQMPYPLSYLFLLPFD